MRSAQDAPDWLAQIRPVTEPAESHGKRVDDPWAGWGDLERVRQPRRTLHSLR